MTVRVHEHEAACVWAYGAQRLADVWRGKKKKEKRRRERRDGDAGVEAEESVGGEELYSEGAVEQKEGRREERKEERKEGRKEGRKLWNGRSLGLAEG